MPKPKANPPNTAAFYRKVERLIGRYHQALAHVVAQRPKPGKKSLVQTLFARKAGERQDTDKWAEFLQELLDQSESFFGDAGDLSESELEQLLGRSLTKEEVKKIDDALAGRIDVNAKFVEANLFADIKDGRYGAEDPEEQERLDEQLDGRVGRYADGLYGAANETFFGTAQMLTGVLMNWILDPSADHCEDCLALSAGGPYTDPDDDVEGGEPLQTYPGDGDTDCLSNCRCTLEFEETSWSAYADAQGYADTA